MSISHLIEPCTTARAGGVDRSRDGLVLPTTHREPPPDRPTLVHLFGERAPKIQCRSGRFDWLNTRTGEVFGESCRRYTCLPCARRCAAQIATAIEITKPSHMFTFTALSGDWAADRDAMNGVVRHLRRHGGAVEWCYTVEVNGDGRSAHCHGYLHGEGIGERLPEALASSGLGSRYDLPPYREGLGTTYIFKEARHNQQSLDGFLARNGGRMGHTTRNFWRSSSGATVSRDEVLAEARHRHRDYGDYWVRIPRSARREGNAA